MKFKSLALTFVLILGTGSFAAPQYTGPKSSDKWSHHANAPKMELQNESILLNNPEVTRNLHFTYIPVEKGKRYTVSYELKTEGVEIKKPHRGATIFIEWADARHNFVRGGDYRGEQQSPAEWTKLQRLSPVVPEGTQYLKLYVALEGAGKAWFRNFLVTEFTGYQALNVSEPAPGTVLDNVFPEFKWQDVKRPCQVTIASDKALTRDRMVFAANEPQLRIDKELPPGSTWYFIIQDTPMYVNDSFRSEIGSFSIAKDAGVWPPQVNLQYVPSTEPRPTLKVEVRAPEKSTTGIFINGQAAEIVSASNNTFTFRPAADLANDVHRVEFRIAAGERQETISRFFSTAKPISKTTFKQGITYIDGKPFFPIGTYEPLHANRDDLTGLKEAGFNFAHSYDYTAIKETTPEAVKAHSERAAKFLQHAESEGLKILLGIPRNLSKSSDMDSIYAYMKPLVQKYPALFAWYLYDEPLLSKVPVNVMANFYRSFKEIDPFHFGYTLYADAVISLTKDVYEYAGQADAIGSDPYPSWRGNKDNYILVKSWTENCRKLAGEDRPVWIALETFDPDYLWDTGKYYGQAGQHGPIVYPNYDQIKCQAFLALSGGANGIIHYSLPHRAYDMLKHAPESWAGIGRMNRELQEIAPFATHPGKNNVLTLELPKPLVCWTRDNAAGETIIAIINPTSGEYELDYTLPVGRRPVRGFYQEKQDGPQLKTKFRPFEVKVFLAGK